MDNPEVVQKRASRRSSIRRLDSTSPETHFAGRSLVGKGFIANNRRRRRLVKTYCSSRYDSCRERAETIVNGFHPKSDTKG